MADIATACRGADIVVEATRLTEAQSLLADADLAPGALLVTYGWIRALDPALVHAVDLRVVDDWAQCCVGGQLHDLIVAGALRREHIHAEIGEIVAGAAPGRTDDRQRILFWHRGFAVSDVVLGDWLLRRAERVGVGTVLPMADVGEE